jgi:hypothetical protein
MFAKNEQDNLSKQERAGIAAFIESLKRLARAAEETRTKRN